MVVRLETPRLILRPMGPEDLEDFLALHGEPSVIEFMGAMTREQATARLAGCQERWEQGGPDMMAVLERSSGRFLGRAGLKYWPELGETEAGWAIRRDAWGQGYATEAGRASIGWGFRSLPLSYITAMIRPDNSRSLAVARRLGMTYLREDFLLGFPLIVHAVARGQVPGEDGPDEVEQLLVHVEGWAREQADLIAVALVGSRARGTARTDSDIDLVLLSRDPERYIEREDWAREVGGAVQATAHRGMLIEQRLKTASGLELDVGIGAPRWASLEPLDSGTAQVVRAGLRIIHDPEGVLARLTEAVA